MQIEWVYNIHRQARAAGSAIFHKQMGEHWTKAEGIHAVDSKGGNMDYWPEELQVREQPVHVMHGVI
jgi:protein gp37